MKLKYEFETMEMDDETVAVPVGDNANEFHGVLKLNESAAFILSHLKEETTEDETVKAILAEYSGDESEIKTFVHDYVAELEKANLLV